MVNGSIVAAALTRGLADAGRGLDAGAYLLDGVATVALSCSVSVGMPTVARTPYKPDLSALLVQLAACLGCTDPASVAALVTRASHHARVLPTCAAAADAVAAALDRYGKAVSETLPRTARAGAVAVRGSVGLVGFRADGVTEKTFVISGPCP